MELSCSAHDLLLSISKCSAFCDYYYNQGNAGKCQKILSFQLHDRGGDRHLPIPWQGHIEKSKILFVSSNPSKLVRTGELGNKTDIGYCAAESWLHDEEKIVDFYESRFDNRKFPDETWTKAGIFYRLINNEFTEFSKRHVPYWAGIRKNAAKMLAKDDNEIFYLDQHPDAVYAKVSPGFTYTLTEIVHCQTNDERQGIAEAMKTCADRYMDSILTLTPDQKVSGTVIALIGELATNFFNDRYNLKLDWRSQDDDGHKNGRSISTSDLGIWKYPKMFIALPHTNSHKKRKFEQCLLPEERDELRQFLLS